MKIIEFRWKYFRQSFSYKIVYNFLYFTNCHFLRKGGGSRTLADLSLRFFNTEVNVKRHLQGIVSKGWISGQSVDPHYFKMIDSSPKNKKPVGDTPSSKIEYSQPLALHMSPAEGSRLPMLMTTNAKDASSTVVHKKTNMQEQNQTAPTEAASKGVEPPPPNQFYLQCKNFLIYW